jgi:S1-C subfamily serine protease
MPMSDHDHWETATPRRRAWHRVVIAGVVVGAIALYFWPATSAWFKPAPAPREVTARGDLAADEQNTIAIFESVSPSVVNITTTARVRDFWTRRVNEVPRGTGSGFVWDDQGHVVTNWHVVAGASRAVVGLDSGRTFDAVLVGASPAHDLAVLKINVPIDAPPPVPVGTSADLRVGQKVFAIGNPFGLDHTLTTGVISALERTLPGENGPDIEGLVQTDAAINPGNSGGPLIDSAGRLIGINTAIYSPSGASAGIGFAVPVDVVNRVVPRLVADGRFVRPVIGISGDDEFSARLLEDAGVQGVAILGITPGSPAERIGLRPAMRGADGRPVLGDVIQAVDGKPVRSLSELTTLLESKQVGDSVVLTLWRDGELVPAEVTLGAPAG